VENMGYEPAPLQLLYHCNFGHPIVDADTQLITSPAASVTARTPNAEEGMAEHAEFSDPIHGYAEQCFFHDLEADERGRAWAMLFNPSLALGAYVRFDRTALPKLVEWKQMGEGDYVVGLEPGTWLPDGRATARERGELDFIQPGEVKTFMIEIGVTDQPEL